MQPMKRFYPLGHAGKFSGRAVSIGTVQPALSQVHSLVELVSMAKRFGNITPIRDQRPYDCASRKKDADLEAVVADVFRHATAGLTVRFMTEKGAEVFMIEFLT